MYRLRIIDINKPIINNQLFCQCFVTQKDIITFTRGKISYNDFRPRKHKKKYKTYKDYFIIEKI